MIVFANSISLTVSHLARRQSRKFVGLRRRAFAVAADCSHEIHSLNPASSFHFASTDYSNSFLDVTQAPNPNDNLRVSALYYLKHIFDPAFWFNDPVSSLFVASFVS